ncbi:MAG: P-loop NTPase [Chloroflexi bacterium]|nr:P-loop NTPase [Chloroflexota bacterium]
MDIKSYAEVIRRWFWLIALMTIVAAGVSFYVVQRQPNTYVAQVRLLVGPTINDNDPPSSALKGGAQAIQTYANLVTTRNVLQPVIDDLKLNISTNSLANQITVTPSPDSQVLTIAVRSTDPKVAVATANALGQALVRLYSERAVIPVTGGTVDTSTQVTQLQNEVADTQKRIDQLEADFKTASQLSTSPAFTNQEKKIAALEAQLSGPNDAALTKQIQDHQTRIQQLEASLNSTVALDARRLILEQLNREDDLMAAAKSQISDQKRLLIEQLGQERGRLASMQANMVAQQNQIVNQLSLAHTQLSTLQRSLDALLPSLQNNIARQITLIDAAANAPAQSSNGPLIVLFAAAAGMVLGLTLAFTFEFLDDRVRTPAQLAESTKLPVWGTMKKQPALLPVASNKLSLVAPADQKVAEAFRRWCLRLMPNGSTNVCSLLVSNFEPGDASARVASNLALTLARAGKSVILIDADINHPMVGQIFQLNGEKGLADWLAHGKDKPALRPIDWVPGLSVLPVGPVPEGQEQALIWPRMDSLLQSTTAQADMVVVAGPPLSSSADSYFLASHVSGVLPIAQINKTSRKQANETIESLRSLGVQVLGSILAADSNIKPLPAPEHRAEMP